MVAMSPAWKAFKGGTSPVDLYFSLDHCLFLHNITPSAAYIISQLNLSLSLFTASECDGHPFVLVYPERAEVALGGRQPGNNRSYVLTGDFREQRRQSLAHL